MSFKAIFAVHLISAMLSLGSAFNIFYTMDLCEATLIEHDVKGTLAECYSPWRWPMDSGSNYVYSNVTKPAKLDGVDVDWFLATDGTPAVNVTIQATSQGSAQDYRIELLTTTAITSIFCTRILTEQPDTEDIPQKQTFGIEIRCPDKELKKDDMGTYDIFVPVLVEGTEPVLKSCTLPTCKNSIMTESNVCKEQEKKRIDITLKQDGNCTVVILNTKSAYPKPRPDSGVYVMIQEKNKYNMWRSTRPPVKLFWPKRTTRFSNLTIGETYQILVWRPEEYVRYGGFITMKEEQKEDAPDNNFIRRIQKRKVIMARQARQESENV